MKILFVTLLLFSFLTTYPLFVPKKEALQNLLRKGKQKTLSLVEKSKDLVVYYNPATIENPLHKNFFSGVAMGTITHLTTLNNQRALHVGLGQGGFVLINIKELNIEEIEKLKEEIKWFIIYTSGIITGEALGSLLCSYVKALARR